MYKFIQTAIYVTTLVSALLLIKTPSVADFKVDKTRESKKIYELVQDVQPELYRELEHTYIACLKNPELKNDSLKIYYQLAGYDDHNAHCGIASGLLKKLLEEKGLKTEYVMIKGKYTDLENSVKFYSVKDSTRGVSSNHIFLKAGNIYIDPTWWQFFDDTEKIKDRIAVGTKEDLYKYYTMMNQDERLMDKHQRIKIFFSLLANSSDLDPNYSKNYALALYAEKSISSDTIKIPIINIDDDMADKFINHVDNYFMQQLDFFKSQSMVKEPKYILKEIFLN